MIVVAMPRSCRTVEVVSNLDKTPDYTSCGGLADVAPKPVHEVFIGKDVPLGGSTVVRRLLPNLGRRLVGPWCFVDHYGPDDIADAAGMTVPPHPHIGLQTVSWLLDGTVRHRDSLGNDQLLGPGNLGVMTSGRAITHAEHSPVGHPALLHGVQLWVALPDAARLVEPAWEFHAELPSFTTSGLSATVIMGSVDGAASPARGHHPIVGADLHLPAGARASLPLESEFEHAVLVMDGHAEVDGAELKPGAMIYLGCGRRDLAVSSDAGARLLLLGGAPFEEQIVMWWNFVARSHEEIVAARAGWESADAAFGSVEGAGARLAAPPIPPVTLKPGGARRN
jgi:redox-sensitive bicupin YhaK (pirin superfamily)